jgi:HK97 family phage major capsid protein
MAKVADRFNSVTELAANPDLAKPSFSNLQYTISTKRGALPVSQESIDDAQADLIGLINDIISQEELNTNNYFIATVLKSFAAKTAADVDDLKTIVNVDLDQAYNKSVICSASFYNAMDQLKDSQGHYLLNDSLSSATGKTFLGLPLVVVDDTLIGTLAGDKVAFIGDLKRAVLFADRKQVSLEWQNDQIYGQYLVGVLRNDVQKADAAAGFYVTYTVA